MKIILYAVFSLAWASLEHLGWFSVAYASISIACTLFAYHVHHTMLALVPPRLILLRSY